MGGAAPVPDFKTKAKGVGGEGHPEAKRAGFLEEESEPRTKRT
jgi:hypothetical protein